MWRRAPSSLRHSQCESPTKGLQQAAAFWETGAEPVAVSAISSTGIAEMLDKLVDALPPAPDAAALAAAGGAALEERPLRVAIVGKPNVGKSSILNCLAGETRSIVNDQSGTTTDAIDTEVTDKHGRVITLIDTAGIRKRAKARAPHIPPPRVVAPPQERPQQQRRGAEVRSAAAVRGCVRACSNVPSPGCRWPRRRTGRRS